MGPTLIHIHFVYALNIIFHLKYIIKSIKTSESYKKSNIIKNLQLKYGIKKNIVSHGNVTKWINLKGNITNTPQLTFS